MRGTHREFNSLMKSSWSIELRTMSSFLRRSEITLSKTRGSIITSHRYSTGMV